LFPALRRAGLALDPDQSDFYQFGVASGRTLVEMRRAAWAEGMHAFGFDTFSGLPPSTNEPGGQLRGWQEGAFRVHKDGVQGASILAKRLEAVLGSAAFRRVHLVGGLYSSSLTKALASQMQMRPAAYVDIDCDLYSSTASALGWLLTSNLIVPGTLIGYDDWWTAPCAAHWRDPQEQMHAPEKVGEWRAHVEAALAFNISLECVAGSCRGPAERYYRCDLFNGWGPVFLVTRIGDQRIDHLYQKLGVRGSGGDGTSALADPMLRRQMLNHWPVCKSLGKLHG
jgi:hypothetical protein